MTKTFVLSFHQKFTEIHREFKQFWLIYFLTSDNKDPETLLYSPIQSMATGVVQMNGVFFIVPGEPVQFVHTRPVVLLRPFFQTAALGSVGGDGPAGGVDISDALVRMVMAASFMEERKEGLAPASKKSIESLPTVCGDESECSICLESLKVFMVKEMPCKHRFHGDCLDKWLGIHGSCPLCRFQLDSETKTTDCHQHT